MPAIQHEAWFYEKFIYKPLPKNENENENETKENVDGSSEN